jgi:hypothetical protein
MRYPDRNDRYPSDCVPTAIAAWTGQRVEDVLAPGEEKILTKGATCQEVYRLVERSGLPFRWHPWKGTIATLPVKHAGLAWIRLGWGSLHVIAFDGKMVVDNNTDRAIWAYDHRLHKAKVFALFLLTDTTTEKEPEL